MITTARIRRSFAVFFIVRLMKIEIDMNKSTPIAQLPRQPVQSDVQDMNDDDDVAIQEVLAEINQANEAPAQMQVPVYSPPPVTIQPPKIHVQPPPVVPQPGYPPSYPPPHVLPQGYYLSPVQAPVPPSQDPVVVPGMPLPPNIMDTVAKHLWDTWKNDIILFGIVFAAMFLVSTPQLDMFLNGYIGHFRPPYAIIATKALLASVIVIATRRFLDSK